MFSIQTKCLAFAVFFAMVFQVSAETPTTIRIDGTAEGIPFPPDMYGIFYEEINHAGDGGIYAERIRNRSFEDHRAPEGMTIDGDHAVAPRKRWKVRWNTADQFPAWELQTGTSTAEMVHETQDIIHPINLTSLRINIAEVGSPVRLINTGYWGIALQQGEEYDLSLYAKTDGTIVDVDVSMETAEGKPIASAQVTGITGQWMKFQVTLKAAESVVDARLVLSFNKKGTILLDEVSLFPKKTWKNTGLRSDLMEMLADLKPAFVRFPGGCIVEGCTLENAWIPRETLGPVEQRSSRWILWGYRSPQGLGLHEYLQMTENLGAASMLVLNCGMACEYRDGGNTPMDEMQRWIDEAFVAIDYAIGPVDSEYGKMRAEAGHPEPFDLRYVEIGNENYSPNDYPKRYKILYDAIKAKYPKLKLISNIPLRGDMPTEIRDDHFYMPSAQARQMVDYYDTTDREGPEIYVGEYAVNKNVGKGNLDAAMAEAIMMIGFEKNADIVTMSSYAPLFYHVNDRAWPVNLIGFDNTSCFGTPSYYVQKLFATQKGDRVLPTTVQSEDLAAEDAKAPRKGGIALSSKDSAVEFKDIEITDSNGNTLYKSDFAKNADGWKSLRGSWMVKDGAYRQDDENTDSLSLLGNPDWTDYTLKIKARKMGEGPRFDDRAGFEIAVRYQDETKKFSLCFGDLKNRNVSLIRYGLHSNVVKEHVRPKLRLANNHWYDIEIRVAGKSIIYFLDGIPMTGYDNIYCTTPFPLVTAIAHRDTQNKEILIRAVHYGDEKKRTDIQIAGLASIPQSAKRMILTSEHLEDENDLSNPKRVFPNESEVKFSGKTMSLDLEPRSLTILRIKE